MAVNHRVNAGFEPGSSGRSADILHHRAILQPLTTPFFKKTCELSGSFCLLTLLMARYRGAIDSLEASPMPQLPASYQRGLHSRLLVCF